MQRIVIPRGKPRKRRLPPAKRLLAPMLLAAGAASCVPSAMTLDTAIAAPEAAPDQEIAALPQEVRLAGEAAVTANAALPILAASGAAASAFPFRPASEIDRMRALDCLAQAIFYEARSEPDEGQRAVAQVVLNRVRHPAWPDTVCGVVYQGPMRAGGGCQFTFTCDGSLLRPARGPAWERARQLAAAFLAGETYAPVGHATHYHTHAVFPAWAPRLLKTNVIGAHNFYRLPGSPGTPGAFRDGYQGREPVVFASFHMMRRPGAAPAAAVSDGTGLATLTTPLIDMRPPRTPPTPEVTDTPEPPSTIREEYRHSGQWRTDAPAAVTGR